MPGAFFVMTILIYVITRSPVIAGSGGTFVRERDEAISCYRRYLNSTKEIASSPHPHWLCCSSQ